MSGFNKNKKSDLKMGWMVLLMVLLIPGCTNSKNDSAGSAADGTLPSVSATTPEDAAIEVAMNRTITATFSKGMNAETINRATFTLVQGAGPVSGTVTYEGTTAVFSPSKNLDPNTSFTANLSEEVKDLGGTALAANKTWSFTTDGTSESEADPDMKPTME